MFVLSMGFRVSRDTVRALIERGTTPVYCSDVRFSKGKGDRLLEGARMLADFEETSAYRRTGQWRTFGSHLDAHSCQQ